MKQMTFRMGFLVAVMVPFFVSAANAGTTDYKTGSQSTYQVPLYDPAGSGSDAYGRYSLEDILNNVIKPNIPAGADGADGIDGKTILSGTVDPTTEGVDGDYYLRTDTHTLFGPKSGGSWPAGVSLIGPTGPQGIQGVQGPKGDTATQPGDLGTAAAKDTGLDIGDVLVVADVGTCSNATYTDQATCEANSGTWTPKAGLAMDVILYDEAPTEDGQIAQDAANHGIMIQIDGVDYAINGEGGGAGDIEGVTAGTGLTGGGTSGTVTLNTDSTYVQRRVSASCAAGSSIRAIAEDGTVTCEPDDVGSSSGTDVGDVTIDGGTATASSSDDIIDGGNAS